MTKLLLGIAAVTILSAASTAPALASSCPGRPYYSYPVGPPSCYLGSHWGEANYHLAYGTRFSHGYYYQGRNHHHWQYRQWEPRYGCYCYYDPCCASWYYWCEPACRYYPVNYCPYDTYSWPASGGDNGQAAPNRAPQPAQPKAMPPANDFGRAGPSFAPQFAQGSITASGSANSFGPIANQGSASFAAGGARADSNVAPASMASFGRVNSSSAFTNQSLTPQFSPQTSAGGGGNLAPQAARTPNTPTSRVSTTSAAANQRSFPLVFNGNSSVGGSRAPQAARTPNTPTSRVSTTSAAANQRSFPLVFNGNSSMGGSRAPQAARTPKTPTGRVSSTGAAANQRSFPNVYNGGAARPTSRMVPSTHARTQHGTVRR